MARGEQGQMYTIIKLVSGEHWRYKDAPITEQQERIPTTEAEQETHWAEHFVEVLNRPPPTSVGKIQGTDVDLDVDTTPPEREMVMATIGSLKNKHVPG